jgi:hypothetical protein
VTDATQDWRAGLRVTRSRSLSAAELDAITQRRRRTQVTALAWLLGSPVIVLLCLVGILVAPEPRDPMLATARVVAFVLVFAFPIPIGFAIANDYRKRAGALRRQSRDATVLVCEGPRADLFLRPTDRRKLHQQSCPAATPSRHRIRPVWPRSTSGPSRPSGARFASISGVCPPRSAPSCAAISRGCDPPG